MDQATQQNAALAEEAATTVASLHEQADQLAHLVSAFKLPAAVRQPAFAVFDGPASPQAESTGSLDRSHHIEKLSY
jgi:methyl-accepting chemotaxis protein